MEGVRLLARARRRPSARSATPAPPFVKPSLASAANAPASSARRLTNSTSSFVSPGRRFTATTAGTPNAWIVFRWRRTLAKPVSIACSAAERSTRGSSLEPGVMLDRADGGHEHRRRRGQLAEPAHDVEELLHPHVGAEPGLGDDVVAELHPDQVGDQRVVAVGDVGERAAVHEHRLPLERLHEVRLDRILEQHGHRAGGAEVLGGDRLAAVERVRGGDPRHPPAQILQVASDGHDRHHLRRGGDVEAGLAGVSVGTAAEADGDVAERPIVHVDGAPPGYAQCVDVMRVAVQDRGIDHRREQVVGGADRVDVTGEVEVQVLHRDDLGQAAAGRAALDPEHRTERRLAQARHRVLADHAEPLGEPDQRRRLALSGPGRRHTGDAHDLAVGPVLQAVEHRQRDLRLVAPVRLDLVGLEPGSLRDRSIGTSSASWAISRLVFILVPSSVLVSILSVSLLVADGRGGKL